MTPLQQQALDAICRLNEVEFQSWFDPSEVMAFCQLESRFRPHSYRYEPRLGEGSYGIMQVLASTARGIDSTMTDPERMYDLETGLRFGMKVARLYWDQLSARLHRDPTYEEWSDSYNRGVGGVLREEQLGEDPADDSYPQEWDTAQEFWASRRVSMDGGADY